MPISYAKLFELLKEKGYTTYKIRQEKLIGQGTLTALKNGTGGLDAKTIARLCDCLLYTSFSQLQAELARDEFRFVVPDFRLNRAFDRLNALPEAAKDKVELLCNACCWFGCKERSAVS